MPDINVATLELSDGRILTSLIVNGDVFVSKTPVDPDIFEDNVNPITVTVNGEATTHDDWKFCGIIPMNDEWWICFAEMDAFEKLELDFQSKIDYISMMTDVDLDF